ncbi:MAG: cytochrome b/b6 domain-containing protein [Gammaproteobacteria bacterium]|nr:cytochrome b/b6 domain-containing protein [Gammaproteobacteria bacterium]
MWVNVNCPGRQYRRSTPTTQWRDPMPPDTEKSADYQRAGSVQILVWDLLVRTGHWLLVLFFFVAYFTEGDFLTIHNWAGYGIGVYVVIRIIWGFVGPKHARFADFAYGPAKAARYVKELILFGVKRYVGHSPAGGLMIFSLLISLTATTVTGAALLALEKNAGPLAPWLGGGAALALEETVPGRGLFAAPDRVSEGDDERDEDRDENNGEGKAEALEEIHEFFSNFTLLLIIMHIAGVVLASVVHEENLARAMITGRKRLE